MEQGSLIGLEQSPLQWWVLLTWEITRWRLKQPRCHLTWEVLLEKVWHSAGETSALWQLLTVILPNSTAGDAIHVDYSPGTVQCVAYKAKYSDPDLARCTGFQSSRVPFTPHFLPFCIHNLYEVNAQGWHSRYVPLWVPPPTRHFPCPSTHLWGCLKVKFFLSLGNMNRLLDANDSVSHRDGPWRLKHQNIDLVIYRQTYELMKIT